MYIMTDNKAKVLIHIGDKDLEGATVRELGALDRGGNFSFTAYETLMPSGCTTDPGRHIIPNATDPNSDVRPYLVSDVAVYVPQHGEVSSLDRLAEIHYGRKQGKGCMVVVGQAPLDKSFQEHADVVSSFSEGRLSDAIYKTLTELV